VSRFLFLRGGDVDRENLFLIFKIPTVQRWILRMICEEINRSET
jgi:hypothetical protein